jgi:hypothetical protein
VLTGSRKGKVVLGSVKPTHATHANYEYELIDMTKASPTKGESIAPSLCVVTYLLLFFGLAIMFFFNVV